MQLRATILMFKLFCYVHKNQTKPKLKQIYILYRLIEDLYKEQKKSNLSQAKQVEDDGYHLYDG